jgi:hypothetical protein
MRIEQRDIDTLIDVTVWLKTLAQLPDDSVFKAPMKQWYQTTRKIYILLLNASEKGQPGLKDLCKKGVDDKGTVANAIRRLCPDILADK